MFPIEAFDLAQENQQAVASIVDIEKNTSESFCDMGLQHVSFGCVRSSTAATLGSALKVSFAMIPVICMAAADGWVSRNLIRQSLLQLEDLCSSKQMGASFHRSSKTTILIISAQGNSIPCALVKLSCRGISNFGSATITDKGYAAKREPVVDELFPEILNNLVLGKSIQARKVLPDGSGVIIENSSLLLGTDIGKIPRVCFWGSDLLTGLAFRFIPELKPFKLSTVAFNNMTGVNLTSLATTLVGDAFSGNSDRSARQNLFCTSSQLWSLDNAGILPPEVDSRSFKKMIKKPNILKKLDMHRISQEQQQKLLRTSLEIATEICGHHGQARCEQVQQYIVRYLPQDPHAALRLSMSQYNTHLSFMCQSTKSSRSLTHHFVPCSPGLQSFVGRTEWSDLPSNSDTVVYVAMRVAERMHMVVKAIQTSLT